MKALLPSTLIIIFLTTCSTQKEPEAIYELPANAVELLAGQQSKTWKLAKRTNDKMRVNMNECTLAFRQTFSRDQQLSDNNAGNYDCGPSINGEWRFSLDSKGRPYLAITSDILPSLFKLKEGSKTKYFQIVTLTDSLLVYRFTHELFTDKTSVIEDTLIPEDAPEGDRNFHW